MQRNAPWRARIATNKQVEMLLGWPAVETSQRDPVTGEPSEIRIGTKVIPTSALTMGAVNAFIMGFRRGAYVGDLGYCALDWELTNRLGAKPSMSGKTRER